MKRGAAIALLALAACSPEPAAENKAVEAAPSPTPAPTPGEAATDKRFDFAGAWAASPEQCAAEEQWRLSREEVRADEASCTVEAIRNETGARATLDLDCQGGKQRWELFAAPADGLTVQRYEDELMTGPQQRLVRCD